MASPISVLTLKVTLRGLDPPIWRQLEVPSNLSLGRLHGILQTVMGWTDSHLHQFRVGNDLYGPPDSEESAQRNERKARLVDVLRLTGARLVYEYDFGDGWEHEVVQEGISRPDAGVTYPVCVDGERACPPEDCGGIPGYMHLLEALRDESHPEHNELLEWVGTAFDPESFSVERVNRLLRSGRTGRRR